MIWIDWLVLIAVILTLIYLVVKWVKTHNKFHFDELTVEQRFADVKLVIQQRLVMMSSLSEVAKKYGIHESDALKETIEARKHWEKAMDNGDINKQAKSAEVVENAFLKIAALQEQYPELKADSIFQSLAGRDSISEIEERFRTNVKEYNLAVRFYNYSLLRFPTSIVARAHGFKKAEFIQFEAEYKVETMFGGT